MTTATTRTTKAPEKRAAALKAPQSIIHIKHKITLRQYKYWVLLLQELRARFDAKAPPDEDGFFAVPLAQIAESMGYTPTKAELRADLETIRKEPISFNVLSKDGLQEHYGAGFISEYFVSTNRIRFKFPSFLEKVMKGLDEPKAMFALINWHVFNHFTGKYEAIIYKLCKDYINSPGHRTPDFTLEQFREYMGVRKEEYPEFKEFNRRVISGPVSNINTNELSDILVEPVLRKTGRSVTGLFFTVAHKSQTSLPFAEMEGESIFRFSKVPIAPKLQQEYLTIRPQKEIMLCIERANEYGEELERAGKTATYGAIYRKAITEGWHEQHAGKKQGQEKKEAARNAALEKAAAQRRAEEESIRSDQEANAKAWALFEALTEDEQKTIQNEFLLSATTSEIKLFKKSGKSTGPFRIYIKKKFLI